MQTVAAFTALWWGVRDPRRVDQQSPSTAVAVFAAAVLVLTLAATASVYLEGGSAALQAETAALNVQGPGMAADPGAIDTSSAGRHFTAVFGGALVLQVGGLVFMSLLFWALTRFLTNTAVGFAAAIAATSAVAGVEVIKMLVYVPLHLAAGTVRVGLHAGLAVAPLDHPYLFLWLQRLDLFSFWQYIAAAICITTWSGLHYRYGFVVGGVIFLVVQIVMAGLTLVAWVVGQGM